MSGTYNKVIIVGRLGKDPELRYTQNGTPVCTMNVATDESYRDQAGQVQSRTEWHRIVVWGKQAENSSQYLAKGRMCLIEGQLQTRKWQDQQGNDRYTTEIRAFKVVFMPSGQGQGVQQGSPGGAQQPAQASGQPAGQGRDPFDDNLGPAFPSEGGAVDEAPF